MAATLSLIAKHHESGNIWSYIFEPSQPLEWVAGQFIRVRLPHEIPDGSGTTRYFTIASAPYERHIQISTRHTNSSFKRALAALPEGGELELLDQPSGDFVWPKTGHYPVFVAQGIGITPFLSMIKQKLHDQPSINATLIYSNFTTEPPFQPTISTWPEKGLQITHLKQPATPDIIARHLPGLQNPVVYLSSPQPAIELLLPPYNLSPSQLKQDIFPNYNHESY